MNYQPLTDEQLNEAEKSWGEAPLEVFEQARRANRLVEVIAEFANNKLGDECGEPDCDACSVQRALAAYRGAP